MVAVGTTVVRALETAASGGRGIEPFQGPAELFITPGFQFQVIDALVTNFHLPRTTLLMLVSAFVGGNHCALPIRRRWRNGTGFTVMGTRCCSGRDGRALHEFFVDFDGDFALHRF